MRLAMVIVLLISAPATAQDGTRISCFDEKPGELPSLLKVPPTTQPQIAGPSGPSGEYDPGYFYLPERNPDGPKRVACGPDGRIWIGAGLELAWMKAPEVAPLLRLGSANGTVLYGGQRIATTMQPGFSLAGGVWMNEARTLGWDASFLYVNGAGSNSLVGPVGNTLLVLPSAAGAAFHLVDPATGHIGAFQAGLDTLFATADVNSRSNVICAPDARLDLLVGYRFARLSDDYEIYGKRYGSDGEIIRFRDEAHTRNDFHGGQIGLAGEWRAGRWFVTGTGKVAFGVVFEDAELQGKYRLNTVVAPNGYYSRPGVSASQEQFAVMPAGGFSFGRKIGDHGRVSLGYQFLYLNRVLRGSEMVQSNGETTEYWLQSASLTAEWRF